MHQLRFWLCLLSSLAVVPRVWADCNDPFGKPNEVLDFHFRIKRADWTALKADTIRNIDGLPPNSEACKDQFKEFPAEFRCGTEDPWLKIGIRKKRGTERGVEAPEKPPLKIDLNEDFMGQQPTAKGQRWPAGFGELGFRKLSLNNGQGNKPPGKSLILPVLLSEHVALRLLKREVPSSPGTAYAKVTLHFDDNKEEYHGVYVLIEDLDRTAIRRRWAQRPGRLVKSSNPGCSPEVQFDDGLPNAAKAAFDTWRAKDPTQAPAEWLKESEKGLDLDTLLRQEAIREILVNGNDTITNSVAPLAEGNNYYFFDPKDGLRQYIPWDVDLMFGQQNGSCAPTPLMCAPTMPLLKWCAATLSATGKDTVCQPTVQKRYLQIMCQLVNGPLSAGEILKVWDEADRTVRPVIPAEVGPIWGGMNPLGNIEKSYGPEYERLRKWIPERVKSVRTQLAGLGFACNEGCPAGATEACSYLGCTGERRCENNLWTPCRPVGTCGAPPPSTDGGTSDKADGGAGQADGGGVAADGGEPAGPTPQQDAGAGKKLDGGGGAAGKGGGGQGGGGKAGGSGGDGMPPASEPAGCACHLSGGEGDPGLGAPLMIALMALAGVLRRGRRTRERRER